MPKMTKLTGRVGPVGVALTMYDIWSRLTPAQRRRVLIATRRHGPTIARAVAARAKVAAAKRRP
jgi:hypothetical protein